MVFSRTSILGLSSITRIVLGMSEKAYLELIGLIFCTSLGTSSLKVLSESFGLILMFSSWNVKWSPLDSVSLVWMGNPVAGSIQSQICVNIAETLPDFGFSSSNDVFTPLMLYSFRNLTS